MNVRIDDNLLLKVQKPARYIGEEWNISRKNPDDAQVRFALCFPDLYEVGMSNLGIRILYGLLNSFPGVACERFFAPAVDLEGILRQQKLPIFSLESKRPLSDFDIVGFSLAHELDYTNILNMLELGGIPLLASERPKEYPLVIGGGACVLNPEPLHAFFDFFVIGEAEEVILEIIETYRANQTEFKAGRLSKQELLLKFAKLPGVYVPSLYKVDYSDNGYIARFEPRFEGVPARITKRFIRDLDPAFFPVDWLVPFISIVHDRITLEVMRGCPNSCSFCQARQQYFPWRIRRIGGIVELAIKAYGATGYEELALGGLSVSEYPQLTELLQRLSDYFKEKGVALSLPSMRPKDMTGAISSLISGIKKTGFTFAPEAATARLRAILNKDFNEDEFYATVRQAFRSGYYHLKLYFMIGLPLEEYADLDAIIDFALRVSELRREFSGGPAQINLSITALIPKPHTPLQWLAMESRESLIQKEKYLRQKAQKYKRLRLHFHNPDMSFLEAVFSRGDRRLAQVLLRAYAKGARFDAWGEHFAFAIWLQAFSECNIEPGFYLQAKPKDAILPWGFLDIGVSEERLRKDLEKLIAL